MAAYLMLSLLTISIIIDNPPKEKLLGWFWLS